MLHVPKHRSTEFYEVILDACLHTKARDAQVEGSRAQYMLDIVRRTDDPCFYTGKILDALSDAADEWDALQHFQIARLLAQEGNDRARQAMPDAFERQIGSSMQDSYAEEFITLDGIPGLLFAVGRIGRGLKAHPERWADDGLISMAGGTWGQEFVWNAIEERVKTDVDVSAYVEAVKSNRVLRREYLRADPSSVNYEQIRLMVASGRTVDILTDWGQIADPAELELAASDLIQEVDSSRLRSYLLVFRKRAFPLGCGHLIQLADMPDGPVPRRALSALECVHNDKVRRLAFSLVEAKSPLRGYSVGLLENNFHHGDHEMVREWCGDEGDPEILNDFDRSLGRFFSAHPNDSIEAQILTGLYDREPCSHCRWFIVKRLLELKRLPEDLRTESTHDCYLETRSLVEAQ